MSKPLRVLVAGITGCVIVCIACLAWVSWSRGQIRLRQELTAISRHAASAADAFRCLADDPANQSERYRALNQARSFTDEYLSFVWSENLDDTSCLGKPSAPLPVQELLDGKLDDSSREQFRMASQALFEVERLLGGLNNRDAHRFIWRSELVATVRQASNAVMQWRR